jgi:quinoprotein glucose dehydrogenase
VSEARNEGLYTPPELTNTIEMPGNGGGANWGGTAADPATGFMYVQSKNAPSMLKLEPKAPRLHIPGPPATQGFVLYKQNCQMCHMSGLQGQPPSIPSLVKVVTRIGDDRIRSAVTNGLSPMPAFPDLNSKDIDSLLAYLTDPSSAKVSPDLEAFLKAPPLPELSSKSGVPPTRYWTGYGYMDSTDGLPAIKGPWSTLTAYDLNKGTIKWQVPLGEVARLAAKGITGTGSYWPRGGVVVTGGGLIFSGTKSDSKIRAYDKDTGKVLWEMKMLAAPEGIPAVYEADGREYLVVSARPGTVLAGTEAGSLQNSEQPPKSKSTQGADKPEIQGYYVFALPTSNSVAKE